jgi:hypothetical protein
MRADFDLAEDGTVRPSGHGGARPNSGPKMPGYKKSDDAVKFDAARARKEASLADMHELDYKIKSGEYVSRAAVRQASATVISALAQTMRSLSDNLERRGVPPAVCAQVDAAVHETLADAARDLEMMSAP